MRPSWGSRRSFFLRCRWALLTNSYAKLDTPQNTDMAPGGFRCLDLAAAPYSLGGVCVLMFGSPP